MPGYPANRINHALNAANVIEMPVDHAVVQRGYGEVCDLLDPGTFEGHRISGMTGIGLYSVSAGWNGDLRWISSGNRVGFDFFEQYFVELDVAEKTKAILGDCGDLMMYSGFFVIRSAMTKPVYHFDYSHGVGMNAMTLMTPVTPVSGKGHLLYEDLNGQERIYEYSPGTAISFGASFCHSTQPFDSDSDYVFLCFTYGVNDVKQWDLIAETVTQQGIIYRHPELGVVEKEA